MADTSFEGGGKKRGGGWSAKVKFLNKRIVASVLHYKKLNFHQKAEGGRFD